MDYKSKYIKYKLKYLKLGGMDLDQTPPQSPRVIPNNTPPERVKEFETPFQALVAAATQAQSSGLVESAEPSTSQAQSSEFKADESNEHIEVPEEISALKLLSRYIPDKKK